MVWEKTLESSLDSKEIQPVHPKGNQSWIFIGRTNVEAKTSILWPPDVKNWLIGKDPDAGIDWRQKEKGTTEDEMVGWCHRLNGHGFGWTPGVGDGQGDLPCCTSWGPKELVTTERLNWTGCSSFTASSFRIWNSSTGILSPPLVLLIVMASKAHLTSHSMKSSSRWVITPSWLSWSWRFFFFFVQFFCVFLPPLLNIVCLC